MNVIIRVTKYFIKKGVKGHIFLCPIALAAKHATGCRCGVFRGSGALVIYLSKGNKGILLRKNAIEFIHDYDSGRQVEPFNMMITMRKSDVDTMKPRRKNLSCIGN